MYDLVIRHIAPWQRKGFTNNAARFPQSVSKMISAIGFLILFVGGAQAQESLPPKDLVNTIWVADNYSYVAVSPDGTVESFQGGDFYIEFVEIKGSVLVAKTQWISPEEKLSGFQHMLFAPQGFGEFTFQAAGAPNVVGGTVNGSMRITSDTEATYTSFNLENNRAGAIATIMNKADTLPEKFKADN